MLTQILYLSILPVELLHKTFFISTFFISTFFISTFFIRTFYFQWNRTSQFCKRTNGKPPQNWQKLHKSLFQYPIQYLYKMVYFIDVENGKGSPTAPTIPRSAVTPTSRFDTVSAQNLNLASPEIVPLSRSAMADSLKPDPRVVTPASSKRKRSLVILSPIWDYKLQRWKVESRYLDLRGRLFQYATLTDFTFKLYISLINSFSQSVQIHYSEIYILHA